MPMAALAEPPNRSHEPAVVAVIRTLPPEVPLPSTKAARNQPAAGASPPSGRRIPQPPSTHEQKMATSNPIAASGTGPELYQKTPSMDWEAPSRNSIK
jgi:hypothetical protein